MENKTFFERKAEVDAILEDANMTTDDMVDYLAQDVEETKKIVRSTNYGKRYEGKDFAIEYDKIFQQYALLGHLKEKSDRVQVEEILSQEVLGEPLPKSVFEDLGMNRQQRRAQARAARRKR